MHCLPVAQLNVQNGAREGKGGREGKGEAEGIASMCCLSLLINKHANAKLLRQLRLHDANCGNCGVWLVACGMYRHVAGE